jgi:hypothetical protein
MEKQSWKAKWAGYSMAKKWLVGGGSALALIALLGIADEMNQPQPQMAAGYAPNGSPNGGPPMAMAPNGQMVPMQPNGYPGAMPQGSYPGGAYPGSGQVGADPEQMAQWEQQQRSQSQGVSAFNQYINGTDTIQNSDTGQVYSGVDSGVADAAVSGGGYTPVATSDLPIAGDGGGAE